MFKFWVVGALAALGTLPCLAGNVETKLLLFGGGNYSAEGISKFCEWSGGKSGSILLIHWASDPTDQIPPALARARDNFEQCIGGLETAPAYLDFPKDKNKFVAQVMRARGVFFTGGDQNQIMDLLDRNSDLITLLRDRYNEGVAFGGTSAGTAIMSASMITGEGDLTQIHPSAVEIRPGLGLLTTAIADQHFIKRSRLNRLVSALLKQNDKLGVGVDEDAAAAILDGRYLQALSGTSLAVHYDKQPTDLQLQILFPGNRFDLVEKHRLP